jgi:alpha-mannosidase
MVMERLRSYWRLRKESGRSYWEQRILAELDFLYQMYGEHEEELPEQFFLAVETLYGEFKEQGGLAEKNVRAAEELLAAFGDRVKEYQVIFAAHAHIDMNWMWGMPETVAIVIDTFQTMLKLLEEYPSFIFSQSQASTYEIIETYAPSMLPEIRKRVQEGRWEVTASSWVEADKNMTGTESMVRQMLYTNTYLQELLGLPSDFMELDFEPDTFGHGRFVPELLCHGKLKYYFHCRGNDREEVYRFRAPSGKELLVYREPNWYLGPVTYEMMSFVPGFCRRNHTRTALCVYGVGDHGGGPTRRDLDRILDMQGWPLLPSLRFGSFLDFFRELEKTQDRYPVVERELNFVFTGCYTSQARLKAANRMAEDKFYDVEALGAMEYLCGKSESNREGLKKGWKSVLFNQFHDILPGSCVEDAVSYSLGRNQEAMSYAMACANRSMWAIGNEIDTSLFGEPDGGESTSEGAGAGYNITITPRRSGQAEAGGFKITETCRGKGTIRAYTLFNTTQYERKEPVELTLWDWPAELERTEILDFTGKAVPFEILTEDESYWQHTFHKILLEAEVPPFGYGNYYVREREAPLEKKRREEPRVHRMEDGGLVLENGTVRAVFATDSMKLLSLVDKRSGQELLGGRASGYFRFVQEEDTGDYSAWIVGAYRRLEDLNDECVIQVTGQKFWGLRKWIAYRMSFHSSSLEVRIILDGEADMLRYSIRADWHELAGKDGTAPQLQFYVPFGYASSVTGYDVAGGVVNRKAAGHDVPAIYFAAPVPEDGKSGLMLTTNCKYGYRTEENALLVNLVRTSHMPDPYPDQGIHHWELGLGVCEKADWTEWMERAMCFSHPIYAYSNSIHGGCLGQSQSFLQIDGRVKAAAFKQTEDERGLLVRYYNCSETKEEVTIKVCKPWEVAAVSNGLEEELEQICESEETLSICQAPGSLDAVRFSYCSLRDQQHASRGTEIAKRCDFALNNSGFPHKMCGNISRNSGV